MRRWTLLTPAVLIAAGACFATKNDIRLLQGEIRASRIVSAKADTAAMQRDQALRDQLTGSANAAAASTARVNDSVRAISQRLASFQSLTAGQLDQLVNDVIKTQELLGQTTRNLQQMRAQAEAAREAAANAAAAPPPVPGDTTSRAPIGPGPATLFTTAYTQLKQGAWTSARRGFEELLKNYPNADEAPQAQLYVGEAFANERNQAGADSVYRLVVARYPKTSAAPTALYKSAMMLWDANKKTDARKLFQRIVTEYPSSDEATLAKDRLARG